MAERKSGVNPIVTGAVLAGAAVAAVALSKENREKAKKLVQEVAKRGKKLMENPEAKKAAGVVAEEMLGKVVDKKNAHALTEAVMQEGEGEEGQQGQKQGMKKEGQGKEQKGSKKMN